MQQLHLMESYYYPMLSYALGSLNLNNSCVSQLNARGIHYYYYYLKMLSGV